MVGGLALGVKSPAPSAPGRAGPGVHRQRPGLVNWSRTSRHGAGQGRDCLCRFPLPRSSHGATARSACRRTSCCPTAQHVRLSDAPEVEMAARTLAGPGRARAAGARPARACVRARRHRLLGQRAPHPRHRRADGRRHRTTAAIAGRARGVVAAPAPPNRANISHHYDVGDAFYRLWLDERMVYSCAYFRREDDTLAAAQAQKLDHICRKLRLAPGERFLDIGCGWGALIFWAAEHYGVDATGITLSRNQFDHVAARDPARGLEGRVRVELRDYLDLPDDALLRQDREHRHVRARGRGPLPAVLRQDPPPAQARRVRAQPRHHARHGRRRGAGQRHRRLRRGLRVPGRRAHARRRG